MSTVNLFLLGGVAVAVILLVGWLVTQPDPTEPRRPRGYRPVHRSQPVAWKPDVEAPLPAARSLREGGSGGNVAMEVENRRVLEEQLVAWRVGHPEEARPVVVEERTEEMPGVAPRADLPPDPYRRPVSEPTPPEPEPVEHHGADEQWSPAEELPPAAPLDPERAVERRAAGRHRRLARTVSPERQAERRIAAAQTEMGETLAPLLRRIERAGHADTDTWEWTAAEFEALRERAAQAGAR